MGTPTVGNFLRRLRRAMAAEALAEAADQDLIERFRADRDEAAFLALISSPDYSSVTFVLPAVPVTDEKAGGTAVGGR